MASNGAAVEQAIAPIIAAYETTTQTDVNSTQKAQAFSFLENFQKSADAWTILFGMLEHDGIGGPVQMFAATSLKGKVIHDLYQLPSRESLPSLRQSLFNLLKRFQNGPKPIRTQLSVSLAHLALQMTEWKDVLPSVISTFGTKDQASIACILEFLKVLAEEVIEGRKISLTEDELADRTKELLEGNAVQVLQFLSNYATSSPTASRDPLLMSCIQSWTREIPLEEIIDSPLFPAIFNALDNPDSFDAAIDCLISMVRETRDVDDTLSLIQKLSPPIVGLKSKIAEAADAEDAEVFKGLARLLSETGENWVVLIAREPAAFKELVEGILEITTRDWEKEAIGYTFKFWEDIKLWLVMDRYDAARQQFAPYLSKLVDNMIRHLQYPEPEGGNEADLFDGDREQEERFRNYRHEMGNVLKDCCEALGVTECLTKPYKLIEAWVSTYGAQATATHIPRWQQLEASLFALRSLGHTIPVEENVMLPRLIPLIVQIPDHEKVRYQAIMTLGRYTEWTAHHPETLQQQLDFIMQAFSHPSKEVVRGATLAFRFFCVDCADLLKPFFGQLHQFYVSVVSSLPDSAQVDVTEGIAAIVAKQPQEQLYENLKICSAPILDNIMQLASNATNDKTKLAIADKLQLITIFIQSASPYIEPGLPHPAVKYCQDILPVLSALVDNFQTFVPILERVCRCWRHMVLSFRTSIAPILGDLASKLVAGFGATRQGCFLWATDSIVREFSEQAEGVDPSISASVVPFFEQQATTFLHALSDVPPEQLPDLIEDFFRLSMDIVLFHTSKAILSPLMTHILAAACTTLTLLKTEVLMTTLHFLRDFIIYGSSDLPSSTLGDDRPLTNAPEIQAAVKQLLLQQGEAMIQRVLTGMMYSFPEDCIPDASGVVLDMLNVLPQQSAMWIRATLEQLPAGAIRPQEKEKLTTGIEQRMRSGESRKIRVLLQDFTSSYRRRNVAPREGLGRLEAKKFQYAGP